MSAIKNRIPITLVFLRLIIGLSIIFLSVAQIENYRFIAVSLLVIGLLTDIFDGIIARQLNISTQRLRRLDSTVDQIFFICFTIATYIQCPDFFKSNAVKLFALVGMEVLTYLVCFLKFRKEIATHTIGAKLWTLLMVAALIQIILNCNSIILFGCWFWVGMITRLEIIMIILTLKKWTTDIPSFYHAMKLRHGKEIKRNKMFNG